MDYVSWRLSCFSARKKIDTKHFASKVAWYSETSKHSRSETRHSGSSFNPKQSPPQLPAVIGLQLCRPSAAFLGLQQPMRSHNLRPGLACGFIRRASPWQAKELERRSRPTSKPSRALMCSMGHHYRLSTIRSATTVLLCRCGSKKLLMTGEGNVSMAPSPVVSAPGELTLHGDVEAEAKMVAIDTSTP